MVRGPADLLTWHDYHDNTKAAALADDMRTRGWQGAPVVIIDSRSKAVTGTHRIIAADQAGIDVPVIDLPDLFAEHNLDLWALAAEYEQCGIQLEESLPHLVEALPAQVIDFYGIDIH